MEDLHADPTELEIIDDMGLADRIKAESAVATQEEVNVTTIFGDARGIALNALSRVREHPVITGTIGLAGLAGLAVGGAAAHHHTHRPQHS
jgi:hypothetical protein